MVTRVSERHTDGSTGGPSRDAVPHAVRWTGAGAVLSGRGDARGAPWDLLRYVPRDPRAPLTSLVRRIDTYRGRFHRTMRGLLGASTARLLVLSLGPPVEVRESDHLPFSGRSFLVVNHDGPLTARFHGQHVGVHLDLEPLGAYRLFGPAPEVSGRIVDLTAHDAFDRGGLLDRLAACEDARARLSLLERELVALARGGPEPDAVVSWVWDRLIAAQGQARIGDLVRETGFSHRYVGQRFKAQVGMPPKTAARIIRFERAATLLVSGRPAAEVAAQCGYTDQSHLSRDVAALSGVPPTVLASASVDGRTLWPSDGEPTTRRSVIDCARSHACSYKTDAPTSPTLLPAR